MMRALALALATAAPVFTAAYEACRAPSTEFELPEHERITAPLPHSYLGADDLHLFDRR